MKVLFSTLTVLVVSSISALGQGAFQDLDFEQAQVVFDPGDTRYIFASDALPGWSAFGIYGTNQLSLISYISPPGGSPLGIDLVSSSAFVASGSFSVYLHGGSISQTALVPANAHSLLFDAAYPPTVSLGGQILPCAMISIYTNPFGQSFGVYTADVSAFAGQTETLIFSGAAGAGSTLDNIQFSSSIVPESSPLCFLFLGSGVMLYLRWRNGPVRS